MSVLFCHLTIKFFLFRVSTQALIPLVDPVYNRSFVSLLKLLVTLDKSKTTKVETLMIIIPTILSHTRPDAPSLGTPPLHLLSTDRRADRPEVTLPPRKRLGISLDLRYEVGESSSAAARPPGGFRVDYGFVATIDREIMRDLERDMTEFTTRVRQDTDEIYTKLDDEHSER
ncbi:hypothetical protein Tco_1380733 [Tanacetum coccineum]